MRIVLGILLIAAGAFGAYMILTGRFPSSSNIIPVSSSGGEKQTPPTSSGGTSGGNLTPTGSGGQSWQSVLTNFGHPMPSVHQGDRLASMGGMY